jgi:hypothetical protein
VEKSAAAAEPARTEGLHHWWNVFTGVPRELVTRSVGKVKQTYGKLEQRYGTGYARAIVGAGLAGLPIPLPGTSALTAAPVLAAAELHRTLSRTGALDAAGNALALTAEHIEALGKQFVHELLHGFPGHSGDDREFEGLVREREAGLKRPLTEEEHRQLLADYVAG